MPETPDLHTAAQALLVLCDLVPMAPYGWEDAIKATRAALAVEATEPPSDEGCESCGQPATVRLADGSTWCAGCHGSATRLGYDDGTGR